MKILISFVLALGFPVMLQARDSVPLPSSLKHLTDKENYFLQKKAGFQVQLKSAM